MQKQLLNHVVFFTLTIVLSMCLSMSNIVNCVMKILINNEHVKFYSACTFALKAYNA